MVSGHDRTQLGNRSTCADTDGEIAGIVMLHLGETSGVEQNVGLRLQIADVLLRETSGRNNVQPVLIGEAQDGDDFIRRTRRDCDPGSRG